MKYRMFERECVICYPPPPPPPHTHTHLVGPLFIGRTKLPIKKIGPQYSLLPLLGKFKKSLDNRISCGALLTDLSKAFDCLNHNLLIAKLYAYGFDYSSLHYITSYLIGRVQRTKVGTAFSSWLELLSGVP